MRWFPLLIAFIVACAGSPSTPTAPAPGAAANPPSTAASQASPITAPTAATAATNPAAAPAKPTEAAKPAAAPTAPATAAAAPTKPAADPNRGVTFGKPVVFGAGGLNTVAIWTTNTTQQVKSFTVKATYKNGDTILTTASGAVNDLRPGQSRAVTLIARDKVPDKYETVRVDVDTMIREAASTPGADAAAKLSFGPPNIKTQGSLSTVDVEVKNGDSAPHSFTVQAAYLKAGELSGVATGAVNDLAPGQTKTATLLVQGTAAGADKTELAIETVIK